MFVLAGSIGGENTETGHFGRFLVKNHIISNKILDSPVVDTCNEGALCSSEELIKLRLG